jgi:16S rRNA (guanine527-N7)-methyltransferase
MNSLTDKIIRKTLLEYGFSAADDTFRERVRRYIEILARWNNVISLTTVMKPLDILRFHFGESLFAVENVPIREGRLADVGTGAGFPGLALGMAVPKLKVTLIESNLKKVAFLKEVSRELRLNNVSVARARMEDIESDRANFDFVTARAVGRYENIANWASQNLSEGGLLVLWLGEKDVKSTSALSGFTWRDPAIIPGSSGRYIQTGSPSSRQV